MIPPFVGCSRGQELDQRFAQLPGIDRLRQLPPESEQRVEFDRIQISLMEVECPPARGPERFDALAQISEPDGGRGRIHPIGDQMKVDLRPLGDPFRNEEFLQQVQLPPAGIEQGGIPIRAKVLPGKFRQGIDRTGTENRFEFGTEHTDTETMISFGMTIHKAPEFGKVLINDVGHDLLLKVHRSAGINQELSDVRQGVVHGYCLMDTNLPSDATGSGNLKLEKDDFG